MTYLTCAPVAVARALALSTGLSAPRGAVRALLVGTALGATITAPAFAQARDYAIGPGRLSDVLARYAAASGVQLVYEPSALSGLQSAGIRGSYTVEQGFSVLLSGSGYQLQQAGPRSYVLVRPGAAVPAGAGDGAVVLDTVTLRGGSATTEGSGSYAAPSASIARGAESLKEVPQSVTVMTSQAIEDQGLTNLSDALTKAPGIVVTRESGNPIIYSRGFKVDNYQIDSLGTSYISIYRPDFDLVTYDRVEILRGAEGLFSGAGEPGGTVNLARKRPTGQFQSSASASVGSWNNRRIEADVSGPLGLDGKLRGRLVGAWQDRDFFHSPSDEKKRVLYGILEYDLTPSTVVSAGISYQRSEGANWMGGLPTYTDGTQLGLPRDVALTVDWAERERTIHEVFATVEHQFNPDWTLKFSAQRQKFDLNYLNLYVGGPVDPATGVFGQPSASAEDDGNRSTGADVSISGRFSAWGREHKLIAGADWRKSHGLQMRRNVVPNLLPGMLTLDSFPDLDLPRPGVGGLNHGWPAWGAKQQGVYARLEMEATDRLHVILGGRYASYRYSSTYELYDADGNVTERDVIGYNDTGIFTPYAGLVYDLTPHWTAYASLTEVYKPQASYFSGPTDNAKPLDPITGRNYEIGAKGELLDGAMNLSAALYRIERKGEAVRDPSYPGFSEDGNSCCYLAKGKIVSQGVDLEVSGEVVPGWQVFAGYTYNHNEDKSDGASYHSLTPRHMFKLWTDYNLPGDWSKWTLGGGVTVKSRHANSGTYWLRGPDGNWTQPEFEIRQGGYSVWDAHVQYQIDEQWALALNVNNVFDKTYYATIGTPGGGNWYGEPRNATLTLRGRF
ncbi:MULTISPECIES: TonB-dependent receptor [Paracoccus]|uniref:TonB-dependent siderophore receptor n=1 Tax=Paracoccus TaxID=265 RepID=UPI001FB72CE6|nr:MULTISPECIES: TonB-dependent receptor [Paracoccus]MCJ1899697.1 TonB-dependent receptor [Paracoccus versutus]MDF3905047.1 TonB-dependent siderophore receptor [Paracoccus sp. AS002]